MFAASARSMIPASAAKAGNGNGEAPTKTCPECDEIVALAATECPGCGYEFPAQSKNQARRTSRHAPTILSNGRTRIGLARGRGHRVSQAHQGNAVAAGIISMRHRHLQRVDLPRASGLSPVPRPRFGGVRSRAPASRTPSNEALDRQDEMPWPSHIRVAPDGKYWRIVGAADRRRRL